MVIDKNIEVFIFVYIQFDARKKFGSAQHTSKYREQLITFLDQIFQIYSRDNNDKNEVTSLILEYNRLWLTAEAKNSYSKDMEILLKSISIIEGEDFYKEARKIKQKITETVL